LALGTKQEKHSLMGRRKVDSPGYEGALSFGYMKRWN
jgi:hypothetical protein